MRHWFVGLFLATMSAGCNGTAPPLVLGHVPAAGADARLVEQERNGIRLALESQDADAKGERRGRSFAVRFAETPGSPIEVEGHAIRLATLHGVLALLGGTDVESTERLAEAGIASFACVPTPTKRMAERVLATGLAPERRGEALGKRLKSDKGAWLALVDADDDESRRAEAAFRSAYGTIASAPLPIGAAAWEALGKKHANGGFVHFGSAASLAEGVAALAGRPFAHAGAETARSGLTGADLWLVSAFAPTADHPEHEAFAKRYADTYHEPAEPHAALAYENARIAMAVLRKGVARSRLADEMKQATDLPGLTKYASAKLSVQRPAFVGRLAKGTLVDVVAYPLPETKNADAK